MREGVLSVRPTRERRETLVTKQYHGFFRRPLNLEKLALFVQRVSGVGLLTYLFFHIFVTGTITGGREAWDSLMAMLSSPFAHIGELLMVTGATFHGVNGVRILLLELTSLVGRPIRPDYPYKVQSLGKGQRSVLATATIMAGLSLIVGVFVLFLEAGA